MKYKINNKEGDERRLKDETSRKEFRERNRKNMKPSPKRDKGSKNYRSGQNSNQKILQNATNLKSSELCVAI